MDVYLTLVSDVTSDYGSNVANTFKVKPQLRLPGEGWKVSIVSAILPRMALFKDLQSETKNLIEMWYDVDGVSDSTKRKKAWLHGNDLKAWEKAYKCRTGTDFMNEVKSLLDERRHTHIFSGKKILDAQWANLEWKQAVGEPELVMEHSDPGTHSQILKKFAETMQWRRKTNHIDYEAGPNLVIGYPSHIREVSELSNGEPTKTDAHWLILSSKAHFRFINLNASFTDALNLHARPLVVTAKVTAGSATITQPLGQVYYAPQGRERYLFTPPVEEFYDVQTTHWDEVEMTLKELDDNLVKFQSDSQCLIRLHFKKD